MNRIPQITVHGRFQPPLHVNHWAYIEQGFTRAEHVTVLITNPFLDEAFEVSASWWNDPTNNPFSYDERIAMFGKLFKAMGIGRERYTFKPFNIKDDNAFAELNSEVPNLVNVYSKWSAKKVKAFQDHGLEVIRLDMPKSKPVSGTLIREIIVNNTDIFQLPDKLIEAGFMPEAVPGLIEVLKSKKDY